MITRQNRPEKHSSKKPATTATSPYHITTTTSSKDSKSVAEVPKKKLHILMKFLAFLLAGVCVVANAFHSLRPGLRASLSMMASGDSHYDYLVIGGGSGGIASARRAAGYGAKVRCVVLNNFDCSPQCLLYR